MLLSVLYVVISPQMLTREGSGNLDIKVQYVVDQGVVVQQ